MHAAVPNFKLSCLGLQNLKTAHLVNLENAFLSPNCLAVVSAKSVLATRLNAQRATRRAFPVTPELYSTRLPISSWRLGMKRPVRPRAKPASFYR
jgi:hypothetical protein